MKKNNLTHAELGGKTNDKEDERGRPCASRPTSLYSSGTDRTAAAQLCRPSHFIRSRSQRMSSELSGRSIQI